MNEAAPRSPLIRVLHPSRASTEVAALAGELAELPTEVHAHIRRDQAIAAAFSRFLANVKRKVGITP